MKTHFLLSSLCLAAALSVGAADFPQELTLIGSDGWTAPVAQTEEPGVYETELTLEAPEFRICALGNDADSVLLDYGPLSSPTVYSGVAYEISAATRSADPFALAGSRFDSDNLISVGDQALVRIELDADAPTGTLTLTKIDAEATDLTEIELPAAPVRYFTLGGIPASGSTRGLLICLFPDGTARKIIR